MKTHKVVLTITVQADNYNDAYSKVFDDVVIYDKETGVVFPTRPDVLAENRNTLLWGVGIFAGILILLVILSPYLPGVSQ